MQQKGVEPDLIAYNAWSVSATRASRHDIGKVLKGISTLGQIVERRLQSMDHQLAGLVTIAMSVATTRTRISIYYIVVISYKLSFIRYNRYFID